MSRRSYGQFCPLARALDRVGDRWTPLIVRDLAAGPRRYSDLLRGLPGIGTTLLAERLKRLEDDAVLVRLELPPPTPATVYDLTPAGRDLLRALVPLATWGLRYLDDIGDDEVHPEWLIMFWQANLDPAAAAGVEDTYEFHVGDDVFHVTVSGGRLAGAATPSAAPADAVLRCDWGTFLDVGFGRRSPEEAVVAGDLVMEGDEAAQRRAYELLAPLRVEAATA